MINIGENLRKERNSKQYSLEYVAVKLEVSSTTIHRMETGNKKLLCLDLFVRYCDLLEIAPDVVFSDKEKTEMDKIALKMGYLMLNTINQNFPFVLSQLSDDEILYFLRNEHKFNNDSKNIV